MRKQCSQCLEYKHPKADFYSRANSDKPRSICKACFKKSKDYRAKRKEKRRPEKQKLNDKFLGY